MLGKARNYDNAEMAFVFVPDATPPIFNMGVLQHLQKNLSWKLDQQRDPAAHSVTPILNPASHVVIPVGDIGAWWKSLLELPPSRPYQYYGSLPFRNGTTAIGAERPH